MKKVMIVLIAACTLISCRDTYNVKLSNGSIIKTIDTQDRDYKTGDTVCVRAGNYNDDLWVIQNTGDMVDTMYFSEYRSFSDSLVHSFVVEKRIGVIQ